ncbi:MAG: hypothetical protein IKR84_02465 [Oscillibacter sp.]|nr:hypothetical protein [Oscillibacter sp.]
MTEESKYSPLKYVGALMALDTAGGIVNIVTFSTQELLSTDSRLTASLTQYSDWTVWALRLLAWALTLAALSSLTDVNTSFGKARIWYLLRILILFMTPMVSAVAHYRIIGEVPLTPSDITLAALALICFVGLALFGEALLSVGYCAVLFAGAQLMDSFGLEGPAKKNRRCGNRLAGCVAAQTLSVTAAVGLAAWLQLVKGVRLFGDESTFGILILFAVLIPLCLLLGLGTMAFRVFAAVRMGRTYRAVKELTE